MIRRKQSDQTPFQERMNDLGSSSPLKLTNTCMMQLPHNAAAAFLQGHASEPNDFHRKWQCFKVKWKSIPTIYRRVMMFWGRATLSHSPLPQGEFSAGPAFHSCFFYSTYKPTYFILLILERRRKGERERNIHWLTPAHAHQGSNPQPGNQTATFWCTG